MDVLTQIFTYSLTLALAAFLPGPGMTGLMFKTLSQGYWSGILMLLGLITGDIIFLSISIFFISYLTQLSSNFSAYIVIISCFYLLFIAYKFWMFNENLVQEQAVLDVNKTFSTYRDGLLITLSNPKTISFYLALVPAIFGLNSLQQYSLLLIIITVITLSIIGSLYIFFSWKIKKILKNIKIQRILLKSLSLMMSFLAVVMLYKEVILLKLAN